MYLSLLVHKTQMVIHTSYNCAKKSYSYVKNMDFTTVRFYPSTYAQDFPHPPTTAFLDFRHCTLLFRTVAETLKMAMPLLKSLDEKFGKAQVTAGNHVC